MCLIVDKELTEKKLEEFKRKGIKEIIVWKVLQIVGLHGYPPHILNFCYYKGKNVPKQMLKNVFYNSQTDKRKYTYSPSYNLVTQGALHVFSARYKSRYRAGWYYKTIRCRVKVEDIIAYGINKDIAVKALYIDKLSERK